MHVLGQILTRDFRKCVAVLRQRRMGLVDGNGRRLSVAERVTEYGLAGGPNYKPHSQRNRSLEGFERCKRIWSKPTGAGGRVEVRAWLGGKVNQYIISMACSEYVA